jgi:hypothetical protein
MPSFEHVQSRPGPKDKLKSPVAAVAVSLDPQSEDEYYSEDLEPAVDLDSQGCIVHPVTTNLAYFHSDPGYDSDSPSEDDTDDLSLVHHLHHLAHKLTTDGNPSFDLQSLFEDGPLPLQSSKITEQRLLHTIL